LLPLPRRAAGGAADKAFDPGDPAGILTCIHGTGRLIHLAVCGSLQKAMSFHPKRVARHISRILPRTRLSSIMVTRVTIDVKLKSVDRSSLIRAFEPRFRFVEF
jgi:hypothetical protein